MHCLSESQDFRMPSVTKHEKTCFQKKSRLFDKITIMLRKFIFSKHMIFFPLLNKFKTYKQTFYFDFIGLFDIIMLRGALNLDYTQHGINFMLKFMHFHIFYSVLICKTHFYCCYYCQSNVLHGCMVMYAQSMLCNKQPTTYSTHFQSAFYFEAEKTEKQNKIANVWRNYASSILN